MLLVLYGFIVRFSCKTSLCNVFCSFFFIHIILVLARNIDENIIRTLLNICMPWHKYLRLVEMKFDREKKETRTIEMLDGFSCGRKRGKPSAVGVCMAQCWQAFSINCNEFWRMRNTHERTHVRDKVEFTYFYILKKEYTYINKLIYI